MELLLEQWDKSREIERDEIYRDLSVERKLKLLSYLAAKKFEQEQYVLFEQAEIEDYISEFWGIGRRESQAVLKAIESQHGLLTERSRRVWSFSHLTFQEYFVAHYMIQDSHQSEKLLTQYLPEQYWQEVFLLFAEMSSDGNKLLKLMENVAQKCVDTANLQVLLAWADQMISSSMNDSKPVAKRTAALILFLAIPFSDSRELPFKRALELYIACAHDRNTAISLASNLASSRARVPATAKARAETYARTRTNNLLSGKNENGFERRKGFNPDCAHALDLALSFEKKDFFKDVDFKLLIADLRKLNAEVPDEVQSLDDYQEFIKHFNQTWFNTFQLHQTLIDLPNDEVEAVSKYLYIAKLMMKCKEVATQICQEIWRKAEENFLLPIVEIEKRKREKAG